MSAGTFDVAWSGAAAACVLAAGWAIKWMDDWVDRDLDGYGAKTWAGRLGGGLLPYAMAALCVALLLDAPLAGSLFFSAYSLGMLHDWRRPLPSGLRGWQEAALAVGAGALLAGPGRMAAALAVMTFVQCADDLADVNEDRAVGRRSLATAMGVVETGLLGAAALVAAAALAPRATTMVIWATAIVLSAKPREMAP